MSEWGIIDSIGRVQPMQGVVTDSVSVSQISSDAVFGKLAALGDGSVTAHLINSADYIFSDNWVFKIMVLMLLAGFCLLMRYYSFYATDTFGLLRGSVHTRRLLGEQNATFNNYMNMMIMLGVMLLGISALRFTEALYGDLPTGAIPPLASYIAAPAAIIAFMIIALYQYAVLRLVGAVTYSRVFMDKLLRLKKVWFSLTVAVLALPAIFVALYHGRGENIMLLILAFGMSLSALFFIIRSLMFFVEQKISILLWFLYLCAVELFPISIAVLLLSKNI
jgi:hypothetical protein